MGAQQIFKLQSMAVCDIFGYNTYMHVLLHGYCWDCLAIIIADSPNLLMHEIILREGWKQSILLYIDR